MNYYGPCHQCEYKPAIVRNVDAYVIDRMPNGKMNMNNKVNVVYNCSCHAALYAPYVTHW